MVLLINSLLLNQSLFWGRHRQHRGKFFFVDGLKSFIKYLAIYESTTINFLACEHKWVFNLHFTLPLDQQSCGRPLLTSRMHVWTIELSQALLGAPDLLVSDINYIHVTIQIFIQTLILIFFYVQKIPPISVIHLNSCDQHMTIVRRFSPPLQWTIVTLDIGIGDKYIVPLNRNF